MIGIDTNVFFYSLNRKSAFYNSAREYVSNALKDGNQQVVITDYVLMELYNLLRNKAVMDVPLTSPQAVQLVTSYLKCPNVKRAEAAPVMDQVWQIANSAQFARRRIFDVRLALTLQHHGVTRFATANVKDFEDLGFDKVWNPLAVD